MLLMFGPLIFRQFKKYQKKKENKQAAERQRDRDNEHYDASNPQ